MSDAGKIRRGLPRADAAAGAPKTDEQPQADLPLPVASGPAGRRGLPTTRTGANAEQTRTQPGEKVVQLVSGRRRPLPPRQWVAATAVGLVVLTVVAAAVVMASRWLLGVEPVHDFVVRYPGEYELPSTAPVGVPVWLAWQHFFNGFVMVLIIRSGLLVRYQKRPALTWSPRANPARRVSIEVWFHQALDLLWLINGVLFVVLLLVTKQWMKIVPTSWEVFPNAASAALQYLSLDWPTENGWVNYNSLQQLAYFTTVFVAAPLSAVTGIRMSGLWSRVPRKLSTIYPIELARKVHFPVMLYFVLFIFVHVVLVLSTGALRNLNHMYAAQGSGDPVAFADNWAGFWIFVVSLAVITAAWIAARPFTIAPIAKLFGTVRR